jgi:ABC-type multidrug transport system permease subunit
MIYDWNAGVMGWFDVLRSPEIRLGDFLVPWVMVIAALGFVVALGAVALIESRGWTRGIWNLPVFFLGLFVLVGSTLGLVFAP